MVFMPGPQARMGSDHSCATPFSYSSWQPPGGMLLTPIVCIWWGETSGADRYARINTGGALLPSFTEP